MRVGVDLEALRDIDNRRERARGDKRQRGEGRPFGGPGAGRAFVFLDFGRENRRRELRRDLRAGERAAAATGLRLCGMVDEPPRPSPAGSKASPISVCISSETSRAILPQVPARMAKARGDLAEPVAMRCARARPAAAG